ncbi:MULTISPECIES: hypothetical protein [unclassified Marinobacter]|jgi:hypothetical protein|uniref:hypothetical protein n=1 Tax=unclassified Marinobacter TaxID=83889 RepID=UPI00200E6C84|nr:MULTISPECIES: hypothetical protein [unclassified Marinobacter]MCL1481428.1 hypothetical protein [Marinobacter sp.]MCL1486997.1 hypothetical protein [Marinobacter sp.]UQG54524.1 hypothetical protein MIH16_13885 [Marinobacter sp. M4C]UQG63329.1 hypothetical protein MIH17_13880 [Marinobacter sp. M2C]UQG67609.1 hypothetical protein MIH19_13885 [Marinobacter sp. M1C]
MFPRNLLIVVACFLFVGCQKPLVANIPIKDDRIDRQEVAWALNDYMERRGLTKIVGVIKNDDTLRIQFARISGDTNHTQNDLKEALEAYVSMPRIERRLIVTFPRGLNGATQELIDRLDGKDHLSMELKGRGRPELFVTGQNGNRVVCAAELQVSTLLPSFKSNNSPQEKLSEHRQTVMKLMGLKQRTPKLARRVSMADGSDMPFDQANIEFVTKYTGTRYSDDGKVDIHKSYFRVYLGMLSNVEYSQSMFSNPSEGRSYAASDESFQRCSLMGVNLPEDKANFLSAQDRPFTAAGNIRFTN